MKQPIQDSTAQREREIYKVTLAGSAVNVILTAFKFVAGILGRSSAMVADAIHSLSDLLTDAVVMVFVHISSKPADSKYDYGHGKFETLAQAIIGVALLVVAGGIFYDAAVHLMKWFGGENLPKPGMLALWAALASIILKELTYQYTRRAEKALHSPALEANAWHHRSDALSSLATLVGIGGAILLGDRWTVLDPVASILVTLFIVRVAWKLLKECFGDLLEASLPEEVEKEILDVISSFPDVSDPHNLRTRRIGSRYAIEFHIRMDGDIPLVKAHSRAHDIEKVLKEKFGDNTHIVVHVEPVKSIPKD
ncbi:MAG: cation transporter [Bacteroidales bacterium]|nr:cation transporter [Bacteroidales bacterium]MBQ6822458.1 cation transporter [Bacteroidales bacterium]